MFAAKRIVGLVIPLELMFGLSMHMVWTTQRRVKRFEFHPSDLNTVQHQQISGDRGTGRLTLAVVCISVCCFLAYPMGVVMKIVANVKPVTDHTPCNIQCYTIIIQTALLMQIINSGINIVFYWAFASKFRQLLRLRLSCLIKKITKRRSATVFSD